MKIYRRQLKIPMIKTYPDFEDLNLEHRKVLHPLFKELEEGISEFTFAGLYLFRNIYNYRISIVENFFIFEGKEKGRSFFLCPFGLPGEKTLKEFFKKYDYLKNASEKQASFLEKLGYRVMEDRENFDYVYKREDLATLKGRIYHKKKNLINQFSKNYTYEARPLLKRYLKDALYILEIWTKGKEISDYESSKEALLLMEELQLCGIIYYVNKKPAAYVLGEENLRGRAFVVHFEKAVEDYKGLYQFINKSFAEILPEKYEFINREQDLGLENLRKAKMSYNPSHFIKKFKVFEG